MIAVEGGNGLPRSNLRKGFHLDAGDGAGEGRQQLAPVQIMIGQFELTARLLKLRTRAELGGP